MTELQNGNEIRTTLSSPTEKHDYRFDVEPNYPVAITFIAPSFDYAVTYEQVPFPLEKGGPANAHDIGDIDFTTEETFHFQATTKNRVYLTVAGKQATALPSDGYILRMTVDSN